MEENLPLDEIPAPPVYTKPRDWPRARMVLLTQIGTFILFSGLAGVLYVMFVTVFGWESNLKIGVDSSEAARWQMRFQLGLGHAMAFLGSGAFTVGLFYRNITGVGPNWPDYLKCRRAPGFRLGGLAVLLMACSLPLVLYTLNINQLIPLPDFFKEIEDQTDDMIKGLLQMNNFAEFAANLTIIAILPALGEELVFRGVIQNQLMRRISNPWVVILLSAAIFSLAHFQLAGFIPRMLLGIFLGWLYWRTNNLWVSVLAHFFNNGVQVLGQYLYGNQVSSVDLEQDIQVPWEFAAMSLLMVLIVARLINQTMNRSEIVQ